MIGFTGQRGVQLFYMISAFTLYLSLDGGRREQHPWTNYFIRRFFRIAPLFYLVIAADVLLRYIAPAFSALSTNGFGNVALSFLFLNGTKPNAIQDVVTGGWSIAVETTFYLILPLLYTYFGTVSRALTLFLSTAPFLGLLSWYLARRTTDIVHEQYFAFLWFPAEFPVFVLGILTYCIWKQYFKGKPFSLHTTKEVSLLLLVSSAVLYVANLPFKDSKLYFSSFLFLPLTLALSIHPWSLLVNSFTRFIGKISYSMYLIHFFILRIIAFLLARTLSRSHSQLIFRQHAGFVVVYLALLALSTCVCVLSWKFIEQPGIRLGRRIIAAREGRQPTDTTLVPPLHELDSVENTRDAQF
jgi:peptidoglycan/LPS O-acetylase OafA/YrhL